MITASAADLKTIIAYRSKKVTWHQISREMPYTLSQLKVIRKNQLKVARPELVLNIGPQKGENRYTNRATVTPMDAWQVFDDLASDAPNWSGMPLVYDYASMRRALGKLERDGLVSVSIDSGERWVRFTEAGKAMATERGFNPTHW